MVFRPLPHRPLAIGRDLNVFAVFLVAAHFIQQPWFSGRNFNGPDLLFGFIEFAGRVGHVPFPAHLGTAGVDHGLAIGREPEGKNVLTVIALVVGDLARHKARRVRHPHIAFALAVEYPGDAVGVRSRSQTSGERRTHYLLQGELWTLGACSERGQKQNDEQS